MTPEIISVDADSLTDEQLMHAMWEAGDLSALMHEGQLRLRDKFHAWRMEDQIEKVHETGSIPLLFALECGKRFGKTTAAIWIAHEFAVWYAQKYGIPAKMRYTSSAQKYIDEIVGSVHRQCFATAPESCKPVYHGKRGVRSAGLYWPADGPTLGAHLAMSGLDKHPDALRGQENDLDFISEASFISKLDYTVRNVLIHQYQGRPWARMVVETSAPEKLYTDWEQIILPDCKKRGACFTATIDDNPRLSRKEKDLYISMAGGRDHANCKREYFNVIASDPKKQVFREFSKDAHVREVPIPRHALTITIADPGQVHLFGLGFFALDFDNARLIAQDSWAESNAGSMKVAAVVSAREYDLWGTWPHPKYKRIPLESDAETSGWRELLRGDRCEHHVDQLYEMAQTPPEKRPDFESQPGKWVMQDLPDRLTYWDTKKNEHRSNPAVRVSDVDKQLIRDIDDHYGLEFFATTKSELVTMTRLARNWLGEGRVVFLPDSGEIIEHVHAAIWPDRQRRAFDEHPRFGHFDLAAVFTYAIRKAEELQECRPHPPVELERIQMSRGHNVQDRMPWSQPAEYELELQRRRAAAQGAEQGRIRSWDSGTGKMRGWNG